MAIIDKFCPNCMNLLKKKDEKCSKCGMLVSDMKKQKQQPNKNVEETEKQKVEFQELKEEVKVQETGDGGAVVDTSALFKAQELENNEEKKDEVKPKRHKHKQKSVNEEPQYSVDKDGSYDINTDDVTFSKPATPSIKKARGDVKKEKIEWWEIYKWAEKILAKRKINKEVKKAATKIPEGISKTKMILWCIFFGWLGIHNFYAKNNKKGFVVLGGITISLTVISVPVLYEIMGIFVGGGLGFMVLALWITDLFGLCFNKYRYRISKEEFISNLNVETRAKLGNKYVDLDKVVFKAKEEKRLAKKNKKKK